jgi:Protein of unknown function (DUF1622)
MRFGVWLLLGLEFELAADIVRTVTALPGPILVTLRLSELLSFGRFKPYSRERLREICAARDCRGCGGSCAGRIDIGMGYVPSGH